MKKTHATILGKQQKQPAFNRTMDQVYTYITPAQQRMSRFLHLRTLERLCDLVGSTLARPIPLITGSVSVVIVVGGIYLIAKQYGYALSGSEPIVAFGFGWLAGMIIDYTRLLIRGKRSHR